MPTRIKIKNREILRELPNDSDFLTDQTNLPSYLSANTMGRVQVKYTLELEAYLNIQSYEIYENTANVSYTLLVDSGDLISDVAIKEGDQVFINVGDGGGTGNFRGFADVAFVTTDEVELINIVQNSGNWAGPAGSLPTGQFSGSAAENDYIFNTSDFLSCNYNFGLIENDESFNTISKISNVANQYSVELDSVTPTNFVDGNYNGLIKSGKSGTFRFRRVSKSINNRFTADGVTPGAIDGLHVYELEHVFRVHPWYRDGEDDDLEAIIAPEDIAKGAKSLKYSIQIDVRRTLSDPNSPISVRDDSNQNRGSVGWFNENFNNLPTQYTLSNVVYQNLTDVTTATTIIAGKRTKVSFLVNSANGTFSASQPFVFGHSKRPSATEYQNSGLELDEVFVCETIRATIGDPAVTTGQIIRSLQATLNSPNEILVEAEIEFQSPEIGRVNDGDSFVICCEVADNTLNNNASDATQLFVDAQDYEVNSDITGLLSWSEMDLYTHPVPYVDGVSEGFTDLQQWNEDGIMVDHSFQLDRDEDAVLEGLTYRLVAFLDENTFTDLDSTTFDLSSQVVDGAGNQQIEVDTTRGFNLADGDQFNWKKLETGVFSSPNMPYTTKVAFKFPWQEWLSLPNAPTAFYDKSEPQNGLNKKTSRYSDQNSYQIRIIAEATVSQNGINTIYRKSTNDLRVRDYDENDGTAPDWTGVIETFTEAGNPTNEVVLTDQITKIKATYTPDVPFGPDPLLYWAVIRIEPIENPSLSIYELSSIWSSVPNNPLVPLDGETQTKISVVSGNVVAECQTDPTKLVDGQGYKVSARFGLLDGSIPEIAQTFKDIMLEWKLPHQNFVVGQQDEQFFNVSIESPYYETLDLDTDLRYKVSNTDPGLGGWGAVAYLADFAAFKLHLENNDDDYYYIEVQSPLKDTPNMFGAILRYRVLLDIGENQTVNFSWVSADYVDRFQSLFFDTHVQLSSEATGAGINSMRYFLKTGSVGLTDYALQDYTDIASLNAAILGITEGVKYSVHWFPTWANASGTFRTYSVDITWQNNDEQIVKQIGTNPGLNYNSNPKARPFNDAWTAFGTQYCVASLNGGAFANYMDNALGANPWTVEMWTKGCFIMLFTNTDRSGGNIQCGLLIDQLSIDQIRVFFGDDRSTTNDYIDCRYDIEGFRTGAYMHLVATYDGSRTAAGMNCYINGVKAGKTVISDTLQPATTTAGLDLSGNPLDYRINADSRFAGAPLAQGPSIWERVKVYSKEATALEAMQLYLDPTIDIGSTLRNWDFNQIIGTTVTETVAADNGSLINAPAPTIGPFTP